MVGVSNCPQIHGHLLSFFHPQTAGQTLSVLKYYAAINNIVQSESTVLGAADVNTGGGAAAPSHGLQYVLDYPADTSTSPGRSMGTSVRPTGRRI